MLMKKKLGWAVLPTLERSRNKVSVGEPAVISMSFSSKVLLVELADRIEDCLSSL